MARQDPYAPAAKRLENEVYATLREYEEHFNTTQVEIKKLASGWMLIVFTAIGFIIRGDLVAGRSLFDSALLLGLIGFGGNIGLISLWILDQRVYQLLMNADFEVGLVIEQRNPDLPPVRSIMWVNSGGRGMARYHALFYACPMFLGTAAAVYGAAVSPSDHWWLWLVALIAAATFGMVLYEWLGADMESKMGERSAEITRTAERWLNRSSVVENRSSGTAKRARARKAAKGSS
jgi:hypothetical protein